MSYLTIHELIAALGKLDLDSYVMTNFSSESVQDADLFDLFLYKTSDNKLIIADYEFDPTEYKNIERLKIE